MYFVFFFNILLLSIAFIYIFLKQSKFAERLGRKFSMLLLNLYLFFVVVKYGDPAYCHVRLMTSGIEQFNVKF